MANRLFSPGEAAPAQQTIDNIDTASLMDEVLNRSIAERSKVLSAKLNEDEWIDKIEASLPATQKGQARRLVTRAMMFFNETPELLDCTASSLFTCVLEAAECGLVIDGRLAFVQAYNNTKKIDGREKKVKEAAFSPSYQGLVAIAKRTGAVHDCYGRCVYEGDKFDHGEMGGRSVLEHTWDLGAKRTKVIGAYAKIVLSTNHSDWRYELMDFDDLERIRRCGSNGPAWKFHTASMYVKTVIRRALKLYVDDPAFSAAVRFDEREYDWDRADEPKQRPFRLSPPPVEQTGTQMPPEHPLPPYPPSPPGHEAPEPPEEPFEPEPIEPPHTTASWLRERLDAVTSYKSALDARGEIDKARDALTPDEYTTLTEHATALVRQFAPKKKGTLL